MSYTITITEKRTVNGICGKEWEKLGEKEVARREDFYVHDPAEPKTRIEAIMGYTPEIEKKVVQERKVLEQTVETLDLASVIKAINGL